MKSIFLAAILLIPNISLAQTSTNVPSENHGNTYEERSLAGKHTAVKLAGLVTFVANSCPQLTTNYDRFKAVIAGLGVSIDALSKEELKLEYLNYAAVYGADVKNNCERAESQFGVAGTTFAGLFARK